jgi:hypothetical protein
VEFRVALSDKRNRTEIEHPLKVRQDDERGCSNEHPAMKDKACSQAGVLTTSASRDGNGAADVLCLA